MSSPDLVYHMCEKEAWQAALDAKHAYFPPTYDQDGGFVHATALPSRLIETANHFYTSSKSDWICIAINVQELYNIGIVTRYEQPMAVGTTQVKQEWKKEDIVDKSLLFPHIYGGIPGHLPGIVTETYPMERNAESGQFLSITGLV